MYDKLFYFFACWLLMACSHIPLTSMMKLAAFDQQDFVQLQPREFQVMVVTQGSDRFKAARAELKGKVIRENNVREFHFDLLPYDYISDPKLTLFLDYGPGEEAYFRLDEEQMAEFSLLQQAVAVGDKPSFEFSVNAFFDIEKGFFDESGDAYFSIYVQLSKQEGFFKFLKPMQFDVKTN